MPQNINHPEEATANSGSPEFLRIAPMEVDLEPDEVHWMVPGALIDFAMPQMEPKEEIFKNFFNSLPKKKYTKENKESKYKEVPFPFELSLSFLVSCQCLAFSFACLFILEVISSF